MREPFGPRDRRLLEEVGAEVGVLVQALVANRALQRSRERLVSAREEERRRLQRDLHDGLGPSLATRLMKLEVARELIATDPVRAAGLVDELEDQTEADIAEVRRLVDGLRPPTLDQLGLVPALRQRADEHNHAAALDPAASVLTWTVSADDVGSLPAAVEVAAYRIVVEAVTNALRHSRGRVCAVSLRRSGDQLRIRVEDDGIGPAARSGPAPGWAARRCASAPRRSAGRARRRQGPGGGTLVEARLPLSLGRACPAGRGEGGVVMEPLRVMVVDDHDEFRQGLAALLAGSEGMQVVGTADNGADAVRRALELQPDVVLMDLNMPRLNGIEATERIVASSPHIGVLVLTMHEDDESVFAAVRAGARGYLLKGVRRADVLRSIEAVGAGEVIFGPTIAARDHDVLPGRARRAGGPGLPRAHRPRARDPDAHRVREGERRDRRVAWGCPPRRSATTRATSS